MFELLDDETDPGASDAAAALGESIEQVQEAAPFALAEALAGLSPRTVAAMRVGEAERVVAATQRVINAVAALQAEALTAVALATEEQVARYEASRRADHAQRCREAADRGLPRPQPLHPIPGGWGFAAASLAPILRLSPRSMTARIERAVDLTTSLPGTHRAGLRGDLEPYRVDQIVRAAQVTRHEHREEFEARLFHPGERHRDADPDRPVVEMDCGRLGERARRVAAAVDPQGHAEHAKRAASRRHVTCRPSRDEPGMAAWEALLPSETSARAWAAIDGLAQQYLEARRRSGEKGASLTSARADAMTDLILSQATVTTTVELLVSSDLIRPVDEGRVAPVRSRGTSRTTPTGHRLDLIIDDDAPRWCWEGPTRWPLPDPDQVPHGVAEYEIRSLLLDAKQLAANPRITRDDRGRTWFVPEGITSVRHGSLLPDHLATWLADPDVTVRITPLDPTRGVVNGPASPAYRPGARLARQVRARDGTCRFPGCRVPATRCDLDHVIAYPHGPTDEANLVALCRAHHGFKHHAGWRLSLDAEHGGCTWTAPDGRSHRTWPQRHLDPSTTTAGEAESAPPSA